MTDAAVLMPDAIILARGVLADNDDVTEVVGERIGTMSPVDVSTAWIRLHEIGGARSLSAPQRLATRNIQVDCFAPATDPSTPNLISGDAGAMKLALLAEAALFAAHGYMSAVGVITYVSEMQGPQSLPDTSRKPPTPRALFTVAITIRPNP